MIRPRISTATLPLGFALILITPSLSLAQNESVSPMPSPSVMLQNPEPRSGGDVASLSTLDPSVFVNARSIADPAERSLALQRIGRTAVFCGQLKEAEAAFLDAGHAAIEVPDRVMRDVRITSVITAILALAEEQLRVSNEKFAKTVDVVDPKAPPTEKPLADPLPVDRKQYFNAAMAEWDAAANFALRISNATYRAEALYKIVKSQSKEPFRPEEDSSLRLSQNDEKPKPHALEPEELAELDQLLVQAASHARKIDRPVWQNSAYKTIVENAASSRQFARGLEIARMIPQPDIRSETLVRLAEAQSISGKQADATATFSEAVEAVASISQGDLRAIIANVLVDNLVTVGRFDDARACVGLYPYEWQQVAVLGAVAESQGRRGLSASAYRWIDTEVAPQHRGVLYRRVADGILPAVERNQSAKLGFGTGL